MAKKRGQDSNNEKLGRFLWSVNYIFYMIRFVAFFSLLALIVLFIMGKPLWWAPIVGVVIFLIRQTILRWIFALLKRLIHLGD
ncbi:MAG: hypothetical protein K6G62_06095 [Eubacterium sp.]|nr:hypothetical protein [Eubacterium sp.]